MLHDKNQLSLAATGMTSYALIENRIESLLKIAGEFFDAYARGRTAHSHTLKTETEWKACRQAIDELYHPRRQQGWGHIAKAQPSETQLYSCETKLGNAKKALDENIKIEKDLQIATAIKLQELIKYYDSKFNRQYKTTTAKDLSQRLLILAQNTFDQISKDKNYSGASTLIEFLSQQNHYRASFIKSIKTNFLKSDAVFKMAKEEDIRKQNLINKLNNFISEKDNYQGKRTLSFLFPFFSQSRAFNEKAYYLLAKHLINELNDPNKYIDDVLNKLPSKHRAIISQLKMKREMGDGSPTINSNDVKKSFNS